MIGGPSTSWRGMGDRQILGFLDIGTSKTTCLIVAASLGSKRPSGGAQPGPMQLIGLAHTRSQGVKAGQITDLDACEPQVRVALAEAERMAGGTLQDVHVSLSAGRLRSRHMTATVTIPGPVVAAGDVARVLGAGRTFAERDGRRLLHLNPRQFRLDGELLAQADPEGLGGKSLAADLLTVSADDGPLRTLEILLGRCHLDMGTVLPTPLASGLAVTGVSERAAGVTVVDLGAGTTTLACFEDEGLVFVDALPMGGSLLTYDLARNLQTSSAEAERIKIVCGTLIAARSDLGDVVSFSRPEAGGIGSGQVSKLDVRQILQPRVSDLIAKVVQRLQGSGFGATCAGQIILTGGGSQLPGLAGAFEQALQAHGLKSYVRTGRPTAFDSRPQLGLPAPFAAVVGMALAVVGQLGQPANGRAGGLAGAGYWHRVGSWLKESL